ncbi:MAG: hypothetical protein DMG50_29970 [Acidobacteria bacterium]|nr:MAG: hypothetical protein DMG50_29970 [Acidobacteriota bacterium]
MRILLILSAVGVAIVALRIFFALKTAHADDPQRQKTSRVEKTVPANTGAPLSVADARGDTGIAVAVPSAVATGTKREKVERKEMWVDSHYCWVVLCKNHWYHLRQNLFFRHRIPLAETDPVSPRPSLEGRFRVQCDDCRKEYFYKPSEVLKYEQELSDSFTPHPLFRDC